MNGRMLRSRVLFPDQPACSLANFAIHAHDALDWRGTTMMGRMVYGVIQAAVPNR